MSCRKNILTCRVLTQLSAWLSFAAPADIAPSPTNSDYVVLLHGLIRSSTAMKRLEWAFKDAGYRVINIDYSSTKQSIEDTAAITLDGILKEQIKEPVAKIHFVTHSLGGIVLREYLANHQLANLGRVVMIAPPNHGSELVDKFRHWPFFKFFTGPAGQELGTDPDSTPQQLPPAHFELGVIAGDRTLNPFYSWFIPGPDDGKVSVASTRLEGMDDFIVVHSSHTYLPWRRQVVQESLHFVNAGAFIPRSSHDAAHTRTTLQETNLPPRIYGSPKMQAMN